MDVRIEWGIELRREIHQLLKDARPGEHVWLVSAYATFDRMDELAREIGVALERGVKVSLRLRGADKDQPSGRAGYRDSATLRDLRARRLDVKEVENLHAKVYLGASRAIVTSMNLVDYSFNNSIEVGLVVHEPAQLARLHEFIQTQVERNAEAIGGAERRPAEAREGPRRAPAPMGDPVKTLLGVAANMLGVGDDGFCIRCGSSIPFDRSKPYCKKDFAVWAKHENDDYEDERCHGCGKPHAATMRKPLCRPCYRER